MTPFSRKQKTRSNRDTENNSAWTLDKILLATRGRLIVYPSKGSQLAEGANGSTGKRVGHRLSIVTSLKSIHFRKFSTDTRTICPGDLFIAISGPNYDGADFADKAIKKGAAGLLIDHFKHDKVLGLIKKTSFPESLSALPVILVENALQALGDLAAYHRSRLKNLRVIAVTGSSGKTTVKEMTAAVLSKKFNTHKSKSNFNNLIGLPVSLLQAEPHHEIAVLEMGMNQPGEIARLTEIADPDLGCIINVHEAHLAGLGSIEGVAQAKNELFAGMKSWGKLIINTDDRRIRSLARQYRQDKITFAATAAGRRHDPAIKATHIINLGEEGMVFTLHLGDDKARVKIRSIGVHNVSNALASAAIGYGAGMKLSEIVRGLKSFSPSEKRTHLVHLPSLGLKVIDDSYNANPSSMNAAIETLRDLKQKRKAIAVLGDMLELGHKSLSAHRSLGEKVALLGIEYLAATGTFAKEVTATARIFGMPDRQARAFSDKYAIADWIRQLVDAGELTTGDWLLLKGSRGMQMDTVLEKLMKN